MSLRDVAGTLASATLMVGLDSGLTHLSAGLGRPTIGIYKASTPVRTPLEGAGYTASLGERGNPPSAQTVLSAIAQARESVVWGKSVSVRLDLGGPRHIKKTKQK